MEMIQNDIAEGLPQAIRRNQREEGVPVIGRKQPTKEVGTVNMSGFLDITAEEPVELLRIHIRIPVNVGQHFFGYRVCWVHGV